jgi:hypothetical protein
VHRPAPGLEGHRRQPQGDRRGGRHLFGTSDADLAAQFGGPAETDWYGHGSWIGGNIAADLGVDVVNISFGGYLDRSDPEQERIYQAYIDAVAYARGKGTAIVASAGNEHVRVGAGGRVISHGQLSTPGDPAENWPDLFGQYETPGGVPGVVDVSSTGRLVVPSSASCPPGSSGWPTTGRPTTPGPCRRPTPRRET